ncbi:MAG TPA: LapA family protein [Solirubrobacteraceae bacterium]|nr:LapA family protein [Solirubrobacteraceae bacterium]
MSSEGTDFEGLTQAPGSAAGKQPPGRTPAERRQRARLISAAVLGAVVTAFALLNLDNVKVHWLVATGQTPLIVVIALAFLLGVLVDRLVIRARRKRGANRPSTQSGTET